MSTDGPLGEVWAFAQTMSAGKGFWYKTRGLARIDDGGRALAKVITTPFNFTRDIIICMPGMTPPGAAPDPSYPILRRAGAVEHDPEAALGLMWGHSATSRTGRGYYAEAGIGWFDRQGRAHGKFDLTINSGFRGYIAICPPGIAPPQDPMPPQFVQPRGDDAPSQDGEHPDEYSEAV